MPDTILEKHLVFSRAEATEKEYVQDRMLKQKDDLATLMQAPGTHIYVCGLKAMEDGVEAAFKSIADELGTDWATLRDAMRESGRYHVETY